MWLYFSKHTLIQQTATILGHVGKYDFPFNANYARDDDTDSTKE